MTPLMLFIFLAGALFLVSVILRVHASAMFIGIASGYLLSQFAGDTASLISSSLFKNSPEITLIAVFLLPVILTVWFMRKSLPSSQMILQILPHAGNSLLFFVLILPLLSQGLSETVTQNPIAKSLFAANDAVVTFAIALQMMLMIITARPNHGKKHRRH